MHFFKYTHAFFKPSDTVYRNTGCKNTVTITWNGIYFHSETFHTQILRPSKLHKQFSPFLQFFFFFKTHSIPVMDISIPAIMAVADQVWIYPYTASHYTANVLIRSKSVRAHNCQLQPFPERVSTTLLPRVGNFQPVLIHAWIWVNCCRTADQRQRVYSAQQG